MKSISTFGEPKGDMVPLITESVTVFSFDAVGFALKFHLVSPGKSRYRRCEVALHLYDYRVNQALAQSPAENLLRSRLLFNSTNPKIPPSCAL